MDQRTTGTSMKDPGRAFQRFPPERRPEACGYQCVLNGGLLMLMMLLMQCWGEIGIFDVTSQLSKKAHQLSTCSKYCLP
ncbi:hypothetical protein BDW62DRAFT_191332 [Aspergillus aurantiobrunneus]